MRGQGKYKNQYVSIPYWSFSHPIHILLKLVWTISTAKMSKMSSVFPAPEPPKSHLGHYRLLAPSASVRVSPLCLGTMNFGDAWTDAMGECSKETAFEILDYYYQNGGNFIDTANNYQVSYAPWHSRSDFTHVLIYTIERTIRAMARRMDDHP